jgi:hypothetical protein
MWSWKSITTAFSLMEKFNLNMLVLHQDTLVDAIVWPEKYFPNPEEEVFNLDGVQPHRRAIQGMHERQEFLLTAREYLTNVSAEAKKRNIKLFFEVTEIEYGQGLEQLHPEILGEKGTICPTTPFWWDFLRAKYTELFDVLPDLDGVIVSPGTSESKLSLVMGTCDCPSCSTTTPMEWYTKLIGSMYEPIEKRGKTLVVRDFSIGKANQNLLMDAVQSVSPNIVAALKATSRDFYITFPNNQLIGHMGRNRQWIEYDCWGQFYGLGLFPCSVVEDIQRRLKYDRENGATGIWFRTDNEGQTDESTFNSFNQLNLIAGALLSQNLTQNIDDPYKAWMQIGLFDPLIPESLEPASVPIPLKHLARLRDFMKASNAVVEKAFYIRGFLFNRNMRFPRSVEGAYVRMKGMGLEEWEPGANKRIEPTEENIAAIIAEKDAALAEVQKLPGILQADSLPVPPEFKTHIKTVLNLYIENVRGFRLCAIGIFRTKQAYVTKQSENVQQALKAADDLQQYRAEMAKLLGDTYFPVSVHRCFHLDYLDKLAKDIRNICSSLLTTK